MIVENKDEITFEEFSAWMVGMIRGKGGAIPDLDDWKEIKKMMDKVVPEKEYVTSPTPVFPDIFPPNSPPPFVPPYQPWNDRTSDRYPFVPYITCNEAGKIATGTTTTTTSGDVPSSCGHINISEDDVQNDIPTGLTCTFMDEQNKEGASSFHQPDTTANAYGLAECILQMEETSKQLSAGE